MTVRSPHVNTSSELIRILHVDDDPNFADLTATLLTQEDDRFEVKTAASASEGLARLAETHVDCIVSDYDMPGQNGIEFLQAVREDYPDLPVILFTGKGTEEVASAAISAGVSDYLQKGGPEQFTVLVNRIGNLVEKHRAEKAKELHQVLVEEATDVILLVSDAGTIEYATPSAESVLKRTPEELAGTSGFEHIHPADEDPVMEAFFELAEEPGSRRTVEFRYERPDGSLIWAEARGRNLLQHPTVNGIVVYTRDITERKEHERDLQKERDRFRAVFEKAFDGMVIANDDGQYINVNEGATELFGLPKEELLGRSIEEFAPEDFDFEAAWRRFQVSDRDRGEFPLVRPDGTERIVAYAATPSIVPGQHLSILRDVTERNRRERVLEEQTEELAELTDQLETQYRHLFEEAPVMAVETRAVDGRPVIEECNKLFLDTLGYDRSEVIGRDLAEFYTPESQEQLLDQGGYERALAGEFVREDRTLVTADGERVETLLRAVPRRDAGDTVSGTLAMYIDISERKELERETERLEKFTGIVSHDLRNPLTVAEGQLELAREECDSEHLDAVANAHDRMNALIEDLLMLAREGGRVRDTTAVDLAELSENCWRNVETANATVRTSVDRTIKADRSRLAQLLENLIRNAVEHGGDDVRVTVGTLADGEGFYVEDDGPGIPEDERDNVFDAGYSTTSDGTGFGLSIVKQVADAHGWTIRVSEGSNGGARFEIIGIEFAV